ncbi:MAG: metal-dependent transcriptional regulator [Thermodesulfobacteriota bacterium]|nr:metal-dependent transcriptional regulator [Thermodesulfobacteriota bacterium]
MAQKALTPTMEDYLEAIYSISMERRVVRVKNIARRVGVKMPTVTNMLKTLSQQGLIDYEKHEFLELTPKGRKVGKEIDRRHHIIRSFLKDILKIEPVLADEEACKIEHGMSTETLNRLTQFIDFIQTCPRTGPNWLEFFDEYRLEGPDERKCLARMEDCLKDLKGQIKRLESGM